LLVQSAHASFVLVADLEWTLFGSDDVRKNFLFFLQQSSLTIQMSLNAITNALIALITHYFVAPPVAPLLLTAPPAPVPALIAMIVPIDPYAVSHLFVPFLFPFDHQSFGNPDLHSHLLVGREQAHQVWYYRPSCQDD
jgi:hypothetical protein